MRRAVLAIWLTSACSQMPPPRPPNECFSGTGRDAGQLETVLLAARPATVTLALPAGCTGESASSVQTSVYGPDDLPVAHSDTGPSGSQTTFQTVSTSIIFTPSSAGNYHLEAKFQPSLGTAQLDVRAALDFTAAEVALTVPLAAANQCGTFAVTAHGAVVCSDERGLTTVFRDGGRVDQFEGPLTAVWGDAVWSVKGAVLTRRFDTGSGPLAEADGGAFELPDAPRSLLPGSADVWTVSDLQVRHWALDGGALQQLDAFAYVFGGSEPVLAVSGDDALVWSYAELCQRLAGHGAECTTSGASLVGSEPNALWLQEGATASRWTPGKPQPDVSIAAVRSTWQVTTRPLTAPYSADQPFTVKVQGREAVLVQWPEVPLDTFGDWVMFRDVDRWTFKKAP